MKECSLNSSITSFSSGARSTISSKSSPLLTCSSADVIIVFALAIISSGAFSPVFTNNLLTERCSTIS